MHKIRIGASLSAVLLSASLAGAASLQDAKRLVVMLKADGWGAGIVLHIEGERLYVATADHVMRKGGERGAPAVETAEIRTQLLPGVWLDGKVVSRNEKKDLAILLARHAEIAGISAEDVPFSILSDVARFKARSGGVSRPRVYVIGYKLGEHWNVQGDPETVDPVVGDELAVYSPQWLARGASGGGMFDENFQLVGLYQEYDRATSRGIGLSIQTVIEWAESEAFRVSLTLPKSPDTGSLRPVWAELGSFQLSRGAANRSEALEMLRVLGITELSTSGPDYAGGRKRSGDLVTIWWGTYGKPNCYGLRHDNRQDTYQEICK